MLDAFSSINDLPTQTPEDKMYLLSLIGRQMLGPKWEFFRKVKAAGEQSGLFGESSLIDQMKATQAALKFTTKSAQNAFRLAYKSTLNDLKSRVPKVARASLPKEEKNSTYTLTAEQDAIIISWTPIKFLLPVKKIRDAGIATERHTEGLASKIFFKVAGYYGALENWDREKLSCYLSNLHKDSTYQEVVNELEPLKQDLLQFSEIYHPFKFGQPVLTKDSVQEDNSFNDAMGTERPESQVRSLYWYNFIYLGIELFLFRYFITLATATDSKIAIRYLGTIFEPALQKSIENKVLFFGSFETDRSKRKLRIPFEKLKKSREKTSLKSVLKTKRGKFESYTYTLKMLQKVRISFEPLNTSSEREQWTQFLQENILFPDEDSETASKEVSSSKAREYILMEIMTVMINCNRYRTLARQKILENFKERLTADKAIAAKRILEVRVMGAKKIRVLERKVQKLQRLKQKDSAEAFLLDIEKLKTQVEDKCAAIKQHTLQELELQKRRLRFLFKEIARENTKSLGESSRELLELTEEIDPDGDFISNFTNFIGKSIQEEYQQQMEPFYVHMFDILQPSTQEKVILIQSLQKSGDEDSVHLALTEEEEKNHQAMVESLKTRIRQTMPDVFDYKVIFLALMIPVGDLFQLSVNNPTLMQLLRLKVISRKNPKVKQLSSETVKALLVLNLVMNPVPKYDLILPGMEKETNPQKCLDGNLLNKLVIQLQVKSK